MDYIKKYKVFESKYDETKQLIEDLIIPLCDSNFIESAKVDVIQYYGKMTHYKISIEFSKYCIEKRKIETIPGSSGYAFSLDEINDYWKDIIDMLNTIKNYGLDSKIPTYAPGCINLIIYLEYNHINNI